MDLQSSHEPGSVAPMRAAPGSTFQTVFRQIVAGVVIGVMGVSIVLSLTTIVFRNELADGFARGAGWSLAGLVVIGTVTALTSSFRGLAAGPQDAPVVVLAAVGAALANQTDDPMATLATFAILASGVTGVLLVVMGRFRWGAHVRQIPYPVVSGFIGGTGVILIMAGADQVFATSGEPGSLILVVIPGLLVGLAVFAFGRWFPRSAISAIVIAVAFAAYYVVAAITSVDSADAMARGFLLGPFPEGSLADLGVVSELWAADWGAIAGLLPAFGAMLLVVPIALLLTTGGLEQTFKEELDEDRELTATGTALLMAAPFAGFAGYTYMSDTVISRRIGGASRIPPLIAAGMAAVVLVVGADLISLVPVAIPAGLLMAIGLDFVVTWVWEVRRRVTLAEYAVILVIVATVAVFGFLPGVGLGVAAATVLFVVRYSRIPNVRTISTAGDRRSRVQRGPGEEAVLAEIGDRILIFELQGYLFFGGAERIVDTVRETVADRAGVEGFIIDMARVTGMDSSAVASFDRLTRFADERGLERMVLSGVGPEAEQILRPLIEEELIDGEADLDRALETKEDELLAAADSDLSSSFGVGWEDIPIVEKDRGSVIITEGQRGAGVYFLESGRARVEPMTDDSASRQALLLAGSVIGELSHLSGGPATATVVADTDCVLRHMSQDWLDDLATDEPTRALEIENLIAKRLAEKLIAANRTIRSLQ